jgi:hypothetical protein
MKAIKGAISYEMVALIIIAIVAAALLYFGFVKGYIPLGVGISEAQCQTDLIKACSDASGTGDWSVVQSKVTQCWGFIAKLPVSTNCESCKTNGDDASCQACCQQDLTAWTG